ncbi:MAG: UDP-N-acetylenolpyruvoylglucosamine reductase, partial [Bacteroidota bacterium]|nr:UDP-N-acetylenolpyruvoylglucosamine reductase [Bacteroidota bacterium]
MHLQQNFALKKYNTFGIDAYAKYFAAFDSILALQDLFDNGKDVTDRKLILGGGSNILFTKGFDGIVLKNEIHGTETVYEDEKYALVKTGAGENWHRFVLH